MSSKIDRTDESNNYISSAFGEHEKFHVKNKKNKDFDKDFGSLRSNYQKTKRYLNKFNLIDREMGSVRSNTFKVKSFFMSIYNYVKSFFTKEKFKEFKNFFSYKGSDFKSKMKTDISTAKSNEKGLQYSLDKKDYQ